MVEKPTVDQSSKFKAELEISLFTQMKKNKSDYSYPLVFALQYQEKK